MSTDVIEVVEVKTIAEVERIVNGSGLWDGTGEVEFSDDGITWTPAWAPVEDGAHPQFARVSVYRKEVRIPTTVTIRWDEQFPAASDEWAGKWLRSPMRHFGRTVRMVGYRQTFRELLGDIRIEDEADERTVTTSTSAAAEPTPAVDRDWMAEIRDADTIEKLDAVESDARAARVFKPNKVGTALHMAVKARRRELTAAVTAAWEPEPTPHTATGAIRRHEAKPGQPNDFLAPSGNRAARRKAARKKGARR